MNEKTLNENKMQEEEAERKKKTKNMLNSQNGKRPLTVNGQYCKQLLLFLLCCGAWDYSLSFLSYSSHSLIVPERAKVAAHTGITVEHIHTGWHSHGLTHTHAHLQAIQVRCAYRDNSAVQCSTYTLADRDTLTFSRSHACTLAHKLSRFWEHHSLCCCSCCNSQCNVAAAQSKKILQILQKYSWHAFDLNNNN